jgi:hypothetical protein
MIKILNRYLKYLIVGRCCVKLEVVLDYIFWEREVEP